MRRGSVVTRVHLARDCHLRKRGDAHREAAARRGDGQCRRETDGSQSDGCSGGAHHGGGYNNTRDSREFLALAGRPTTLTTTLPKRPLSYWQGRIVRHLTIALTALSSTALFWALFSVRRDVISHLSIATAYPALLFTAGAVLLGPCNVLRGRPNPVSSDLRRDVGIWAGIMALLHTAIGLDVHLRGRPWLYFVDQHGHLRHDLFGFGNYTGVIAALLFLLLLAISNDLSLRRFGPRKWKSLQRWTYGAVTLTVLHGIAYQHIEKRQTAYEATLWGVTAIVAIFQVAGWRRIRLRQPPPARPRHPRV